MMVLIIKIAGNIKGDNSTNFLVDLLGKKDRSVNEIIEALWLKKTKLRVEAVELINYNVDEKIEQSKYKVNYYSKVL
ncbi:MAG: hypothetical protein WKG06_24770 [Segetibacter sp.]